MFAASVISALAIALPAQVQNDHLSIAAIRLGVTDLKNSIEFYTKHLGWQSANDFSPPPHPTQAYAMLENHGVLLVLTPVKDPVSIGEGHCHARINFAVKNLDESMASMKAAGVRFIAEKHSAVGRYATFVDPSGNQHNIKQLDQPIADEPIDSPRVYDVGISVSDMTQSIDFYVNVLGFEELTRKFYPPVVPIKQRGCTFFILSEDAKHNAPYLYGQKAHCGLALAVDDLEAAIKRLREKNVRFLHDQPQSAGNVRYIAFADPFGNVHELITHTVSEEDAHSNAEENAPAPLVSSHAPPSPKASDLAWMAGTWVRQEDGSHLEEIWTAPQDGALLGSFRWHRDGKPWMYELMSIQEEEGELVFRLRHFDAQFTPWEKDGPLIYRSASPLASGKHEVVFESAMPLNSSGEAHTHPKRIVYRLLKADGELNNLVVRLESADANQKPREFVFTRGD